MSKVLDRGLRDPVIANIRAAIQAKTFNVKVEVNDPGLDAAEEAALLTAFWQRYPTAKYRLNNWVARTLVHTATRVQFAGMTVSGKENLAHVPGGAIVTSNHFNPHENMAVRKGLGLPRLFIVSQATNLKMPGLLGYIMNYADILPLGSDVTYLGRTFPQHLNQVLAAGHKVLIYPEQEMWYNYIKPRPPKRGAYFYAAQANVPIISMFVSTHVLAKKEAADFYQIGYAAHILPPIFPNESLSVRENSQQMMATDFKQKQAAFEAAYQRPYDAPFTAADIAGWIPGGDKQ
ncbi:lysophospholipid acyltransferase family protein [Lacticaseibacillus yichunensis]|uniref:Lysophospholipid acyltransferase family protein n=1 Tax=Lacticaseibacillus yichunensis TaxID=2486015 RepID=A0ABW4CRH6_9LACO|nr:lysophospholipid acyltransferase family protein [Lacticaseibacillus yichunensis]